MTTLVRPTSHGTPWSLALGAEPLSRLGWGGMTGIVLGGLVLNGLILSWLTAWLQRLGFRHDAL